MNTERLNTIQVMRSKYLSEEISHQEYYLWLAKYVGLSRRHIPVPLERLQASRDEHFNDIPLQTWDNVFHYTKNNLRHGGYWSLSDNICCLKALARQWVEQEHI